MKNKKNIAMYCNKSYVNVVSPSLSDNNLMTNSY